MVRVLLISDIRLYREGIAGLLANDDRLEVVATAASIDDALRALESSKLEVALLDMGMSEARVGVRAIADSDHDLKVVALGISETRSDVLSCAEAGVQGYVCRESSLQDLVEAVLGAVEDELRCPPRISAALMGDVARLAARTTARDRVRLTCRGLEIAELIDSGLGNREIADQLHIAISTVKVHVHNILDKLGVSHRGAAAAKLRRRGLLRLPHEKRAARPTPTA